MANIKIIREPSVYLVGKQIIPDDGMSAFLRDHGLTWKSDSDVPAEVLAETAGRLCYMSFASPRPGGNSAYLEHIKEASHGSVLECAVFNFVLTGISRSLSHELIRHRAGTGFSQLSQRYVDESIAEYVLPPDLREEIEAGWNAWVSPWARCDFGRDEYDCLVSRVKVHQGEPDLTEEERIGVEWLNAIATQHRAYVLISNYLAMKAEKKGLTRAEARKFARQAARSVLPNATETKIAFTANARALRNILEQRGSRHAEPEIRKLANKLLDVLQVESPNLFGDYRRVPLPDGTCEIETEFRKV